MISRFLANDPDAFEAIITHYQNYVFAIVLNFVGENEAPDLAQEIFLQLYRSLPRYRPDNLKAWIGKIAVNKAIDWKRTHSRFSQEHIEMDANTLIDVNSPIPDEIIIKQENQHRIQAICQTLPSMYQRVIVMFYYENKSYQQIANEERVSLKTVESRLYRARSLIRQRWKEEQA
ncbi:MAG: sigma-70 family RNA polymerase sigma factor [Syntrophomonas sp.]